MENMEITERRSGVISALKRLERAGDDHSRTTAKLLAAAGTLSDHVIAQLGSAAATVTLAHVPGHVYPQVAEELPRGYAISDQDGVAILCQWHTSPDEGWHAVNESRANALAFADDVATGWLDELADWLLGQACDVDQARWHLEHAEEVQATNAMLDQ